MNEMEYVKRAWKCPWWVERGGGLGGGKHEGKRMWWEGKAAKGEWKGVKMHPNSNIFFLTAGFYIKPGGSI